MGLLKKAVEVLFWVGNGNICNEIEKIQSGKHVDFVSSEKIIHHSAVATKKV